MADAKPAGGIEDIVGGVLGGSAGLYTSGAVAATLGFGPLGTAAYIIGATIAGTRLGRYYKGK